MKKIFASFLNVFKSFFGGTAKVTVSISFECRQCGTVVKEVASYDGLCDYCDCERRER